jgi:serine/threonine-protein kinase
VRKALDLSADHGRSTRTPSGPTTRDAETDSRSSNTEAVIEGQLEVGRIGTRLGSYHLLLPLARGGMGLVFAGQRIAAHGLERLVAIKTLRPVTSAHDRAALLAEAKLTSRLHHKNVVATLDLGEVDDVPYVVMELVEGVALSRLLSALGRMRERLSPELATWIVMQAAQGLHAAHELADGQGTALGLVHRDVSPQNILMSKNGEVKIADFGIAKYVGREESTATGLLKGKLGYMSPEQTQCTDIDRRSDVFALGIVYWEALVGEKLFTADTPARTILRVMNHAPPSPSSIRTDVDAGLDDIVLRCLEKDKAARFSTAGELAEALRAALRASKARVDESDLSTLLQRLFGEECTEMSRRLHEASRLATRERVRRSRSAAVVASAMAVATVIAASLWIFVGRPNPPRPAPMLSGPAPSGARAAPPGEPLVDDPERNTSAPTPSASATTSGTSRPASSTTVPRAASRSPAQAVKRAVSPAAPAGTGSAVTERAQPGALDPFDSL